MAGDRPDRPHKLDDRMNRFSADQDTLDVRARCLEDSRWAVPDDDHRLVHTVDAEPLLLDHSERPKQVG
ncbi:hypothetical protein GCM10023147_12590 [Tsukamurella soli]|uniref:Uncharacterized protein n=1 Tax=Tsukamurella soli TaxID=644556 RepID=A0ABP8JAM6_9ACTN